MSFNVSVADRPDWAKVYFMASCKPQARHLPERVVRRRCPVCGGALFRSHGMATCRRCRTIVDDCYDRAAIQAMLARRFSVELDLDEASDEDAV